MPFRIQIEKADQAGVSDNRIWILMSDVGDRLGVAPARGFNAYRWSNAKLGEVLYAPEGFLNQERTTRGGIPILFPFPNRIRGGQFDWRGKDHQLPRNDSTLANAIHGFACRHAWRIVGEGADAQSAWVTGEFQASRDAPETCALWPADYVLRVTYRLLPNGVRIETQVTNPDKRDLPFGLGFHPYFALASFAGEETLVQVPAHKMWDLHDCLPSGEVKPVDAARDLRHQRPVRELRLDDVLTGVERSSQINGQVTLGAISGANHTLHLSGSPDFREVVVFTPPHRQAVCIEPYTCATDAVNLGNKGIDAGWRVLEPGGTWRAEVEFRPQ